MQKISILFAANFYQRLQRAWQIRNSLNFFSTFFFFKKVFREHSKKTKEVQKNSLLNPKNIFTKKMEGEEKNAIRFFLINWTKNSTLGDLFLLFRIPPTTNGCDIKRFLWGAIFFHFFLIRWQNSSYLRVEFTSLARQPWTTVSGQKGRTRPFMDRVNKFVRYR